MSATPQIKVEESNETIQQAVVRQSVFILSLSQALSALAVHNYARCGG